MSTDKYSSTKSEENRKAETQKKKISLSKVLIKRNKLKKQNKLENELTKTLLDKLDSDKRKRYIKKLIYGIRISGKTQ